MVGILPSTKDDGVESTFFSATALVVERHNFGMAISEVSGAATANTSGGQAGCLRWVRQCGAEWHPLSRHPSCSWYSEIVSMVARKPHCTWIGARFKVCRRARLLKLC